MKKKIADSFGSYEMPAGYDAFTCLEEVATHVKENHHTLGLPFTNSYELMLLSKGYLDLQKQVLFLRDALNQAKPHVLETLRVTDDSWVLSQIQEVVALAEDASRKSGEG